MDTIPKSIALTKFQKKQRRLRRIERETKNQKVFCRLTWKDKADSPKEMAETETALKAQYGIAEEREMPSQLSQLEAYVTW